MKSILKTLTLVLAVAVGGMTAPFAHDDDCVGLHCAWQVRPLELQPIQSIAPLGYVGEKESVYEHTQRILREHGLEAPAYVPRRPTIREQMCNVQSILGFGYNAVREARNCP